MWKIIQELIDREEKKLLHSKGVLLPPAFEL